MEEPECLRTARFSPPEMKPVGGFGAVDVPECAPSRSTSSRPTWPRGHGGWFFSEPAEYEANAASFLAEGVRQRERAVFLADDPGLRRWPERLLRDRVLVLGSVRDVYAPLLDGDLDAQRSVLARAVDEAQCEGFTGIRIAADNTSLVNENIDRWIEWESVAELFIAANPVAALCGFDRSRLALDEIHSLMVLHPRTVGSL